MPPIDRSRRGIRLLTTLACAATIWGCLPEPAAVPVECRGVQEDVDVLSPGASGDTLDVRVHLDRPPEPSATLLMVRVDPLSEPGAVTFDATAPSTAAAVSVALVPGTTFQGCLGAAPTGFRLRAAEAPRGRVWVRISSDRPVSVELTAGDAGAGQPSAPARVLVTPGASGEAGWGAEAP